MSQKPILIDAGAIQRQEIGALADGDGRVVAHLFYNRASDCPLLASITAHEITPAGAVSKCPADNSGWFGFTDKPAAESAVKYLARAGYTVYLLRRQHSIATTVLFGEEQQSNG